MTRSVLDISRSSFTCSMCFVQSYLLYRQLLQSKMTQRQLTLKLIGELIGGCSYVHKAGHIPAGHADSRYNIDIEHYPAALAKQSRCMVHKQRVDTKLMCNTYNVHMSRARSEQLVRFQGWSSLMIQGRLPGINQC